MRSRGQSIPFWTFATIGTLAMLLFVLNFALNTTWTIRAQSAADAASSATHSAVANIYNEESVLLYAAAVDEYRLRAINAAILNTINHNGGCSSAIGGSCERNYAALTGAFVQVAKNYADLVHLMGQANQLTQGGTDAAARKIFGLLNCGGGGVYLDCAFNYTFASYSAAKAHGKNATPSVVQIVACRSVPWVGGGLVGMAGAFQAVASGASAIAVATPEQFVPSAINPATNRPYQRDETSWFGYTVPAPAAAYTVAFGAASGGTPLTIGVNWYTVTPYANASNVTPGSYSCAS